MLAQGAALCNRRLIQKPQAQSTQNGAEFLLQEETARTRLRQGYGAAGGWITGFLATDKHKPAVRLFAQ